MFAKHVKVLITLIVVQMVVTADHDAQFRSEFRLPMGVKPENYVLHMHPYLQSTDGQFKGKIAIKLSAQHENITEIVLNSKQLNYAEPAEITSDKFLAKSSQVWPIVDSEKEWVIFKLKESLDPTFKYFFELNFTGSLSTDMFGFFRDSYLNEHNEKVWFASTQFAPMAARRAFPCFDEPEFKARFQINLVRGGEYSSVSNMPLKYSQKYNIHNTSWILDSFEATPPISTYLVAFTISDFRTKTSAKDTRIAVVGRENTINNLQYAASVMPNVVNYLEWYTNQSFDYKLSLVSIPNLHFGAMENWGHITIRESNVLSDAEKSSPMQYQTVTYLLAHEISHLWFGDFVTMDWFSHVWLNEGFATYFEYKASNFIQPDWELSEKFLVLTQQSVMLEDSLASAKPMTRAIATTDSLSEIYSDIVYSKAASIIRMFEYVIGEETFRNGIMLYFQQFTTKTVRPKDLFSSLQMAVDNADGNVYIRTAFITWSKQPGYPVVQVSSSSSTGFLYISQSRFYQDAAIKKPSKWWIPLSYTTHEEQNFSNTRPRIWMQPSTITTSHLINMTKSGWVIFNIKGTGYYRVNYDIPLWDHLIRALRTDNFGGIPSASRSQLIDDALNLARANLLDYNVTFSLLEYLQNDVGYLPWYSAFKGLTFILQRLQGNQNLLMAFQDKVLMLMKKLRTEYDSLSNQTDTHTGNLTKLHTFKWACKLNESKCIEKAHFYFQTWKIDGIRVSTNIRESVYCTALKHGNCNDANFLWNQFVNETLPSERDILIKSLACSSCDSRLELLMNIVVHKDSVYSKYNFNIWSSVAAANPSKVLLFFKNYYDSMIQLYGDKIEIYLNEIIKNTFKSDSLASLRKFLVSIQEMCPIPIKKCIQTIRSLESEHKWNELHESKVSQWVFATKMIENGTSHANTALIETYLLLFTSISLIFIRTNFLM